MYNQRFITKEYDIDLATAYNSCSSEFQNCKSQSYNPPYLKDIYGDKDLNYILSKIEQKSRRLKAQRININTGKQQQRRSV